MKNLLTGFNDQAAIVLIGLLLIAYVVPFLVLYFFILKRFIARGAAKLGIHRSIVLILCYAIYAVIATFLLRGWLQGH